MPSVLPATCVPMYLLRSHLPSIRLWYAGAMLRDRASISAIVCSAVLSVLPAGVFITTMPCRVAASLSMLSVPTPARTIAFSRRLPSSAFGRNLHAAAADRAVELRQRFAQRVALSPVRTSYSMPGAASSMSRPS